MMAYEVTSYGSAKWLEMKGGRCLIIVLGLRYLDSTRSVCHGKCTVDILTYWGFIKG